MGIQKKTFGFEFCFEIQYINKELRNWYSSFRYVTGSKLNLKLVFEPKPVLLNWVPGAAVGAVAVAAAAAEETAVATAAPVTLLRYALPWFRVSASPD